MPLNLPAQPTTAPMALTPLILRGRRRGAERRGFTLTELLIVIGIIALLISILVPVIGRVRIAGQTADTSALIRAIDNAIQAYQGDHQAWPGPLADGQMGFDGGAQVDSTIPVGGPAGDGFFRPAATLAGVTGSENLVLGLMGGLIPFDSDADGLPDSIGYDPAAVGRGPVKLNTGGRSSPGGYSPYFDAREDNLSMHVIADDEANLGGLGGTQGEKWGRFVDAGSAALDTIVPEFLDRYSDPMPILFMRAIPAPRITAQKIGDTGGLIIATDDVDTTAGVYHQGQIAGYVGDTGIGIGSIGVGKGPEESYYANGVQVNPVPSPYYHGLQITPLSVPTDDTAPAYLRGTMNKGAAGYTYPYDARAYLLSPTEANARQADRYVLLSAGPDRVYGTEDDITP